MSRRAFLQARQQAIGASDVAPLMGLGDLTYGGPVSVYASKVGTAPEDPSPGGLAAAIGLAMEPALRRAVADRLGDRVGAAVTVPHPDGVPLVASLDAYIWMGGSDGCAVPVELKTCAADWTARDRRRELEHLGRYDVPPPASKAEAWWVQVQSQMACTGAPLAYLAVVLGPMSAAALALGLEVREEDLAVVTIDRDEGFIELLEQACTGFWHHHVVPRVPPTVDALPADYDTVREYLRQSLDETIHRPDLSGAMRKLAHHRDRIRWHEQRKKALIARLLVEAGEADTITTAGPWKASLKQTKRGRPVRVTRSKSR